jgi:Putative phage replication protein RstA
MPTGVINIDYVAFTLRDYTRPDDIMSLLGLEFEELGYGMRRYRRSARGVGHAGLVLWDGAEQNMGVHVVLSGEVLRLIECMEDFPGWEKLIDTWRAIGATFTRLDIALDDLGGSISWESVRDAFVSGHVSCRAHAGSLKVHQTRHGDGWLSTLTVGSRQSERFLRCYEKCMAKGDAFDGLRFELECKQKYAEAAATALIDHGWAALAGMVAAFVTFTDRESSDATKSRRPAAAWWRDFVGSLRHVVDVASVTTACIQRRYSHLKKQYAQTFHVLTSLLGGSTDWVYEFIELGGERLNRVNRNLLRFWEKQNYVPNLAGG